MDTELDDEEFFPDEDEDFVEEEVEELDELSKWERSLNGVLYSCRHGFEPDDNLNFNISIFFLHERWPKTRTTWKLKLMMAVSSRQIDHHTISGNISLFQIHQKLKKVVLRLQSANFVTKPSVVAVLPEQRPTSWGALY